MEHNAAILVAFKNCTSFINCITKVDETTIDDAEDLDLVMPIYNLIEYNSNYSYITGSLRFYSKGEATNFDADVGDGNNLKSFSYNAKLITKPVADGNNSTLINAKTAVPLKSLSDFWRLLKMPLINCKVDLKLKWTKHCVLASDDVENDNADSNNIIFSIKIT